MKTETIEWSTPEEKLPPNDERNWCIGFIATREMSGYCFYNHELKIWCWVNDGCDGEEAPPLIWEYAPKGPK